MTTFKIPKRFILEESDVLVTLREKTLNSVSKFLDESKTTYFFSVNLPTNKNLKKIGFENEYGSYSFKEQHAILELLLTKVIKWTKYLPPVFTKTIGENNTQVTLIRESGTETLFKNGFIWFEATKQFNCHFHMLVECDWETATEIKSKLLSGLGIKTKVAIAVDYRVVTTGSEFIHYVNKDGEFSRKQYESVDWDMYKPIWFDESSQENEFDYGEYANFNNKQDVYYYAPINKIYRGKLA